MVTILNGLRSLQWTSLGWDRGCRCCLPLGPVPTLPHRGMCDYGRACIWRFGVRRVQVSEARLALQSFSTVTPFHVVRQNRKNEHHLRALSRWSPRGGHGRPWAWRFLRLACMPRLQTLGVRIVTFSAPRGSHRPLACQHSHPTIPNSQGRHGPGHYPGISACGDTVSCGGS